MIAIRIFLVLSFLCGFAYPIFVTGIAGLVFPHQAHGSRIERDGQVTGSELIGQFYDAPRYFWPRPSMTSPFPYNAASSSGSNVGPSNPARAQAMESRRGALMASDPGNPSPIPMDLLTASGSGLDPHISPEAALWQVRRIARIRTLEPDRVVALVSRFTEQRQFGFLGEPRVNVVLLNQALDRM